MLCPAIIGLCVAACSLNYLDHKIDESVSQSVRQSDSQTDIPIKVDSGTHAYRSVTKTHDIHRSSVSRAVCYKVGSWSYVLSVWFWCRHLFMLAHYSSRNTKCSSYSIVASWGHYVICHEKECCLSHFCAEIESPWIFHLAFSVYFLCLASFTAAGTY
jgi:hypothetical protein